MTTWSLYCQDLTVLGLCCTAHDCSELARWSVYWPGQGTAPRCDHHMAWAGKVAETLGFQLQALPLAVREPEEPSAIEQRVAMMEMT